MKRLSLTFAIFALLLPVLTAGLNAEGIKERLARRLPLINKMKAAGLIGENNKGYLAVRTKVSPEQQRIVKEENSDRKKIYELLAKKTGQSVDVIGRRRALAIAKKTKTGYWLQKEDGTWYRK